MTIADEVRSLANETDFSGVVTLSIGGSRVVELARGHAHRAHEHPNTINTQFATASGTKGFTALTIGALIESGQLSLGTTWRSLAGDLLPLVDPAVTIEHLLGHTSGAGDYLDEEELGDIDDYVVDAPVHRLVTPADYLPLLDGFPQRTTPGRQFAYNNSGYVMLSYAAEVAGGSSFHDLVTERVLDPAGMSDTAFLRSDELPARAAIGYCADGRSNVFHLPVRGAGDGGIYTTVDDMDTFWAALFAGRILPLATVDRFTAARSDVPAEGMRYGLGFWLRADRPTVMLEGMDAGVSFRSAHDRPSGLTYTVISNTSSGAWPIVRHLDQRLPVLAAR